MYGRSKVIRVIAAVNCHSNDTQKRKTYAAQALSIDDAGRLVVQREGGRTEALRCGEVTIRPTKTE